MPVRVDVRPIHSCTHYSTLLPCVTRWHTRTVHVSLCWLRSTLHDPFALDVVLDGTYYSRPCARSYVVIAIKVFFFMGVFLCDLVIMFRFVLYTMVPKCYQHVCACCAVMAGTVTPSMPSPTPRRRRGKRTVPPTLVHASLIAVGPRISLGTQGLAPALNRA